MEKREITTNTAEIQTITREYYEQVYAKKVDNLQEMDEFQETCKLPKLKQEEIENTNRYITSKEIESVVSNFPTNKIPGLDGI